MLVNQIKRNDIIFVMMLFFMMLLLMVVAFFSLYLSQTSNLVLYKIFLNIILLVATLANVYILINVMVIIHLLKGKKISLFFRKWVTISLRNIYPHIIYLSRLFGFDKDKIRSVFSEINNRLILASNITVLPQEILVLLPHCLQKSSCLHKITGDIHNCKQCGSCDIHKLILLHYKYHVKLHVATGGTLARKVINETKPKAIIAVACERDLISGILDIKNIPIIGILNERPEGPCVNTRVNIDKVEKAIQHFIGKED